MRRCLWRHLFFVARACSNSARSDPRHVRMLSESSTRYTHRITTIGCVVRVEARGEERAAGTVGAGSWDGISLLRSALRVTPAGTHRSSQIANCLIYSGPEGRHISRGELPADSLYPCDTVGVRYMNRCRRDPQWCSVTYSFFSVCVINGMIHETAMM